MKRIIRLTESDLTRIVKRVIKEQYHENIETPSDDDLRSKLDSYKRKMETPIDDDLRLKFDSYKRKMENFLRELKSSVIKIDKRRFLKQVQKETDQMFWDVYDNSDSEPEGFVELQMDLINHFKQKLNESYRSRVIKENEEGMIRIPRKYNGVRMELGKSANPQDIIEMYNELVEEGTALVDYSEEGMFYNEDDQEIPTDVILDELNYAIVGEEEDYDEEEDF
jgi:hypothetical protein